MEKDRTISLQAAIDAIKNADVCVAWNGCTDCEDIADIAVRATKRSVVDSVEALPSAQPEITDCDYCHEDSDGYVTPLEKNCHAFVTYSPIDGWILSLKANGWHGEARIKFCPMCGRRLGGQNG